MSDALNPLPRYDCHKQVEAAEIMAWDPQRDTVDVVFYLHGDKFKKRMTVPANFFARGYPGVGDFLVRYADGYLSWSPRAVFLGGYTLASSQPDA